MKKTFLTLISIIALAVTSLAQNVNIPDANFKSVLLANRTLNKDQDKLEISFAEASSFVGNLDVHGANIKSVIGIEAFTKITGFQCWGNQITTLDISKNTALKYFDCYNNNSITSLDLSKNTALVTLQCNGNLLTSLDLSKNTALTFVNCGLNQLTSINLSNVTLLTSLYCSFNSLTNLDVSKNLGLADFNISQNKLSKLDVSKNIALLYFECIGNNDLLCIGALDTQDKTKWKKDLSSIFSESCITGISEDETLPTLSKSIFSIFNLQGQEVENDYQGMVIIRYSDGTIEKKIK